MGMGTIRTSWRRSAATTVLAGASALALAAPSVSAAPNAGPDQFAGQALAKALDLKVTLPSGLTVAADSTINQLIAQTLTELDSQGKVAAKSILGSGDLLNESLSFSGSKKSDSRTLLELPDNPVVKLEAGKMSYTADADERVTRALSELTNLKVGLGEGDAQDLIADLRERLTNLVGTPGDVPATGTPVEDMNLNELLENIEAEFKELGGTAPVELPEVGLPTAVPNVPEVTDLTNLVNIQKLWSETSTLTESETDSIVSQSEAGVTKMSLVGGLINVPEFEFSSLAKTDGTPGGAVAEAVTKKLALQLAGDDLITLEGDTLTVGGETVDLGQLPLQLDHLNELLGSILNSVGVDIAQARKTEEVAKDGSHALAKTEALTISLSPLQALAGEASGLNVALSMLPTAAEVRAGNVAAPKVQPPAAVQRPAPTQSLPRTGGGAVAVLLGGLAIGGAYALRRFTKS